MAPQPQNPRHERTRRAQTLDRLLQVERGRLVRQARLHSRRSQDAEDALGDACVQFLRFYDGSSDEHALRWMMIVVKRCAWAIARRAKTREAHHYVTETERAAEQLAIVVREERSGPAELTERSEETARLLDLIDGRKPDERTALALFGLGCSYAEIGELRGWSATKVNRSVGRAHRGGAGTPWMTSEELLKPCLAGLGQLLVELFAK